MKRRLTGLLGILLAAAGGLAIGLHVRRQTPPGEPLQAAESATGISISAPAAKPHYRLAGKDGKLAVFIIGKTEPELVFDIYLHHLPDVDRLRLEEGIEVQDYQQLLRLIEDYTS
jgi:hypothetical protein